MAKKVSERLPPLTGISRQVLDYVLTNVALGGYSDCCGTNEIALTMDRDPKRFRSVLAKLAEAGYITISGKSEKIYPTVAAIQHQNPRVTETQAKRLLAAARRKA
jgi:hypothetical protein